MPIIVNLLIVRARNPKVRLSKYTDNICGTNDNNKAPLNISNKTNLSFEIMFCC